IRHNKKEGAFRKPPEKSRSYARHPHEPIDPRGLRAWSACLRVGGNSWFGQGLRPRLRDSSPLRRANHMPRKETGLLPDARATESTPAGRTSLAQVDFHIVSRGIWLHACCESLPPTNDVYGSIT